MFEYFREIFYKRALIRARRDWNLRNWKVKEILRKDIATGVSASRDVADNCAREKLLFIEQYRMLWMELFSIQLLFGPPFFLFFFVYIRPISETGAFIDAKAICIPVEFILFWK